MISKYIHIYVCCAVIIILCIIYKLYCSPQLFLINKNTKSMLVTVTAYCPGSCCNGRWAGKTSHGKTIQYYISRNINICAVDKNVIPMKSIIYYNNKKYLAIDVGGKIKGQHIDLLFSTHKEATKFGVKFKQRIKIEKI